MKKTIIILLHFGYWLLYLLLLTVIFTAVTIQVGKLPVVFLLSPLVFLFVAPNLLSFYSFYFLLFTKFLSRKKFPSLIIFGIIVCLISAVSGSLVSSVFYGFDQPIFNSANEFSGFTILLGLIAAVHGIIALIIRGFISWYAEIRLKEELTEKNYEMKLALINSQINPHFLFNTINNIDVLITKDAMKASEYLNRLSDILRYMVYETKAEKIPLANEISYIEKYLELQKIRTANPDYITFEVIGETNNLLIAPMIFFPFIENAFKHTENNKRANSIKIKVSVENKQIFFDCENSYQNNPNKKQEFGGLGNELIRKRLMLMYLNEHSLETLNCDGVYKIKLSLDEN